MWTMMEDMTKHTKVIVDSKRRDNKAAAICFTKNIYCFIIIIIFIILICFLTVLLLFAKRFPATCST